MKYIEFINDLVKKELAKKARLLVFGQNVCAGSCLGGLTENLTLKQNSRIINTPNSENSLVGFGFGLMISGVSSVYFMKQLDFLLLGVDQLVNTYGFIRNLYDIKKIASFTIVAVVYDQGYQGVQSSLNTLGDFCSIGRLPGLVVTNALDAKKIISTGLVAPGFCIIGVSACLSKDEIITPDRIIYAAPDNTLFQYTEGSDATIACFNFSFPQGWELLGRLKQAGMKAALFGVNSLTPVKWSAILQQAAKTHKLIIIDDSKSANLACDNLAFAASQLKTIKKIIVLTRQLEEDWLNPISDQMNIDYKKIIKELKK